MNHKLLLISCYIISIIENYKLPLKSFSHNGENNLGSEVKKMAELLKSGATMLSELCPECGNPLFKIKNEIFCVKCNKPVVIVKATESEIKALAPMILAGVEQTILSKIQEINSMIKEEKDLNRMIQLGSVLSGWLSALEKVKKLRESFS